MVRRARNRIRVSTRGARLRARRSNLSNSPAAVPTPDISILNTPSRHNALTTPILNLSNSTPSNALPLTQRDTMLSENGGAHSSSKINGISLLTTFFDGEPAECHHFFKQFNDIAELSGWSNREKLTILKTRLKGNALTFIQNDQELSFSNDYDQVKESLIKFFSEDEGLTKNQTQFNVCNMWEGENVKNFAYRVSLLTNNYLGIKTTTNQETLKIIDRLKLSKFINSLIPEIQIDVLKSNPQTFQEAVSAASNSQRANETIKKMSCLQVNNITKKEINEIKCAFCGENHYSNKCEVYQMLKNPPQIMPQESTTSNGNNNGNYNPIRSNQHNRPYQNNNNYRRGQYNDYNRGRTNRNRGTTFRGRYFRGQNHQNPQRQYDRRESSNNNDIEQQNDHFLGENSGTQL